MNALIFTRYGQQVASSRQRFYAYKDYLEASGIKCTYRAFFWPTYLSDRFFRRRTLGSVWRAVLSYGKRVSALNTGKKFDLVWIQTEAFPYVPAFLEQSLLPKNVPRIYDYDDAWFHYYDDKAKGLVRWALGGKIHRLIRSASAVTVGSRYLHEYATRFHEKVSLLPTAIELERYPKERNESTPGEPFAIGWIGSPATFPCLQRIQGILRRFCEKHNARVIVIGAGKGVLDIPTAIYLPWDENSEIAELSKIDVGLMPLSDTPFERGKCAYKLIQYMGCWKPVIASPIGENRIVVENGRSGFLAATEAEWSDALEVLYKDRILCRTMGERGRQIVEERYTTKVVAPRLRDIFEGVMRRGS